MTDGEALGPHALPRVLEKNETLITLFDRVHLYLLTITAVIATGGQPGQGADTSGDEPGSRFSAPRH